MKPTILAAFVVAATTISLPAWAQPPRAVVQLTLDEAITRGLDASHRLGELKARRDAADASGGSRHAAMLPQVSAQAGYARTNHVDEFGLLLPTGQLKVIYPDIPDNVRSRLDMQWPIYTGGRVDALERAARAETSAAETDIATARLDLRLEITRAYWALVTAIESIRVVDQSLARVDAHLRDVRNRLEQGLVPPNEVLTLEAQRARQQMLAVQARAVRDNAETDLARLTGVEPGTGLDPQSALTPPAVPSENATTLVATAHGNRAERAGLTSRVEAANARVVAAAAGRKPVIAIGGGVDFARPNTRIFPRSGDWNESWDASINLNWPIFDGGRTKAEVAEATAGRRAVEERLADFDVNVAAEVRQRLTDVTASTAAIAAAGEAVKAAAEARRVVADRYAAGVATNTEVVDAQVAQLQAELDRTQAIASARLAEARLARALGR